MTGCLRKKMFYFFGNFEKLEVFTIAVSDHCLSEEHVINKLS